DMEFIQFHPTTLYLAGAPRFLITEAVRGEGAWLRNARGERFMGRYAPDQMELAPRDVVATASIQEMQRTGSNCVYLDLSTIPAARIRERFPTIQEVLSQYGLDIVKDRIPVRPAAHYMMGGVQTDMNAQTTIRRLMAAGEVACTGVHGANRLASNSLLEGLVFGYEAGRAAIEWANLQFDDRQPRQLKRRFERTPTLIDAADVRRSLQSVMWYNCGVFRDAENLASAAAKIDQWQRYVVVRDPSDLAGIELQNMLLVSRLMLEGAFRRKESRGAHRRTDWPNVNDERWKLSTTLQRETFESVITSQTEVAPPIQLAATELPPGQPSAAHGAPAATNGAPAAAMGGAPATPATPADASAEASGDPAAPASSAGHP
ncbi:MAG: L-aspartate oxidase, partial [Planctomycetota bacterium]